MAFRVIGPHSGTLDPNPTNTNTRCLGPFAREHARSLEALSSIVGISWRCVEYTSYWHQKCSCWRTALKRSVHHTNDNNKVNRRIVGIMSGRFFEAVHRKGEDTPMNWYASPSNHTRQRHSHTHRTTHSRQSPFSNKPSRIPLTIAEAVRSTVGPSKVRYAVISHRDNNRRTTIRFGQFRVIKAARSNSVILYLRSRIAYNATKCGRLIGCSRSPSNTSESA